MRTHPPIRSVCWRAIGFLVLTATMAFGCGTEEQATVAQQPIDPPPAEDASASMTLDPPSPQPGERFSASFDESNSRGGYFFLFQWDGVSWGEAIFILQSDANGRGPTEDPIGSGGDIADYGVGGGGPDGLVAPEDMQEGYWRLCTANAVDHSCAQFEVVLDAS